MSNHGDFPSLGISLAGIHRFIHSNGGVEAFLSKSTGQVCEEFILKSPTTSYCEFMRIHHASPDIGPANVFVSHAWRCSFLHAVSALERWAAAQPDRHTFFWFDLFSNPQIESGSATGKKDFSWWSGCFRHNVGLLGHTLLVLQWEDPVPLTPAWCVWELACTVTTRSKLEVVMSEREVHAFQKAMLEDFESIMAKLCGIEVEAAEADPADREGIRAAIQATIGFYECNATVIGALRAWMAKQVERALAARPDKKSPSTIRLLCRCARLLVDLGQLAAAEQRLKEAYDAASSTLKPDDPLTLEAYFGLATCPSYAKETLPMLRTVVDKRMKLLGAKHEDTLVAQAQLADALRGTRISSNVAEAEDLALQVMRIRQAALGESDMRTLYARLRYGMVVYYRERPAEAETILRAVLHDYRTVLRNGDNPDTLVTMKFLASVTGDQGKVHECGKFLQDAMSGCLRVYGECHGETISTMMNYSCYLHYQLGRSEEGLALAQRALACDLRQRGEQGELTATWSYATVGLLLHERGRAAEAEPYLRKALDNRKRQLAPGNPLIFTSYSKLADALLCQGKHMEALHVVEDELRARVHTWGESDSSVELCKQRLDEIRRAVPNTAASSVLKHVAPTLAVLR